MTNARHRFTVAKGRRVPTVAALALGVIGALLITLAACSSRSGPPQPSASSAGTIGDSSSSVSPVASAVATSPPSGTTSGSAGTSPAPTTVPSTKTADSPTPAPSTTKASSSAASPTSKIVPPSFANAAKGLVLLPSAPVSLSIPAIGAKSDLLTLGLNPDGTVQVPSLDDPASKAGWYKNSPTPGSVGPAIILGHIDSKKYGPGIFYELGNLKPGDEVDVTRQDGSVAVFKIDGVRSYPKNAFPTAAVYGKIDHAGLRLITCGGTFDPSISSYESNIVAFASLVSSR
jgi:hypothetical protein